MVRRRHKYMVGCEVVVMEVLLLTLLQTRQWNGQVFHRRVSRKRASFLPIASERVERRESQETRLCSLLKWQGESDLVRVRRIEQRNRVS